MRVLVIPDIHGEDHWKQFINLVIGENPSVDKAVFLGDYLDSYTIDNGDMLRNFAELLKLKKENPDKVTLLYGNHEYSYVDKEYRCSGFRAELAFDLQKMLSESKGILQNAYQIENIVFTHAGIENSWFTAVFKGLTDCNVADQLNNPCDRTQLSALHHVGWIRGGINHVGGIFWCDRRELTEPLKGYIQVVGHTPVPKIQRYEWENSSVFFTDTYQTVVEPYIFDTEIKDFVKN